MKAPFLFPLLISFLYSSLIFYIDSQIQASSAFQSGEKRLLLESPKDFKSTNSNRGATTDRVTSNVPTVLTLWRRNLAMILGNKGTDWKALVISLGDKLMKNTNEQVINHTYACNIIQYHIAFIILYSFILYYTVPYYNILHHIVLFTVFMTGCCKILILYLCHL